MIRFNQKGFSTVEVIIVIVIIVILGFVGYKVTQNKQVQPKDNQSSQTKQNTQSGSSTVINPNQPPLKLKTIGVNLDNYNSATNYAGDFVFTKAHIELGIILSPYGQEIPGNSATGGKSKINPQSEFRVPMGTKVHSLVDGIVVNVPKLYSDDYSIQVGNAKDSNWLYETEHVIKPLVKPGDHVTAGQVIAEVSPHSKESYDGLGLVEIGILKGGNPPSHVCPFAYLDDSIKDLTLSKISAFMKSWESYRGNTALYNEAIMKIPGCLTLDPVQG